MVYLGGASIANGLADGAAVVVSLSGNLPDALALDEVSPSDLFSLVHCVHP